MSPQNAFDICFKAPERLPLFKVKLIRQIEGLEESIEELLEDPHSELFVNISGVTKVTAVFRDDSLKPVYKQYVRALHFMQGMDLEMPQSDRPTTLKKLIKRYFVKIEHPYGSGPRCSGCQQAPKIYERHLTHFPKYFTVLLNRESRIAGVRAFSKRICELPITAASMKIFGIRYALSTVIVRQELFRPADPSTS